jgi:hypothetical protein
VNLPRRRSTMKEEREMKGEKSGAVEGYVTQVDDEDVEWGLNGEHQMNLETDSSSLNYISLKRVNTLLLHTQLENEEICSVFCSMCNFSQLVKFTLLFFFLMFTFTQCGHLL